MSSAAVQATPRNGAVELPGLVEPRGQAALRRAVQRESTALLNQQCWLWGCDIRHTDSNLLLAFGFTRTRPPGAQERSTQYTCALPGAAAERDSRVVRLWGSGMYFGTAHEGLFLNRFATEPRHAAFAEAWQDPALLKRGPRHWHHELLAEMFAWVAAYERWIAAHTDRHYRGACLLGFPASVSQQAGIAPAWQRLADMLGTTARIAARPSRPEGITAAAC